MMFDPIETITFIFAFVAFVFIVLEVNRSKANSTKNFWKGYLLIAGFIVANRFFTNIEALFLKDLFNVLEHISMVGAGAVFLYTIWNISKTKWKVPL